VERSLLGVQPLRIKTSYILRLAAVFGLLVTTTSCSVAIRSLSTLTVNATETAFSSALSSTPISALVRFENSQYRNVTTYDFTITDCTNTTAVLIRETNSSDPTASDPGWQACTMTIGALHYTLTNTSQGYHSLYVYVKDLSSEILVGDSALIAVYDTVAPVLVSATANDGATYMGSAVATMKAQITDTYGVSYFRAKAANYITGDCQSEYADDAWVAYVDNTSQASAVVNPVDGMKKICVWGKDRAGNISVISPSTGNLGTDADDIQLQIGNPPIVASFSAANNAVGGNFGTKTYTAGDQVLISWSLTDVEGLDNNPVSLAYTTDGSTWISIVSNYGGLSGNPTTYSGSYTAFNAPAGYFRFRLIAKDMAGNSSAIAISDVQNTGAWSVYAGSAGIDTVDSGPLTARLYGNNAAAPFAINKATGDVYAIDDGVGIKKFNAQTGVVSIVIADGANNMPVDGPIPANPQMSISAERHLKVDSKNRLYYVGGSSPNEYIQQIDFGTGQTRRYIGGGVNPDWSTATPSTINFRNGPYAFDEQDSLYFMAECTPGGGTTVRLTKALQNTDGTAGALSHVAGNCVPGNPTSGVAAANQPFTGDFYLNVGSISVWDNGAVIVYKIFSNGFFKILNGVSYSSNITQPTYSAGAFNPVDHKFYTAENDFRVRKYTINESGADGDTRVTFVKASGTGACTDDGVDAVTAACVKVSNQPVIGADGTVFFADGENSHYRIRYVDAEGKVRTLMGSQAVYGHGIDKRFSQGYFQGIYYKQVNDASIFGKGLYFVEPNGNVFGKMDEVTGIMSILHGNQTGQDDYVPDGTPISKNLTAGQGAGGGGMMSLTFDASGLPWFRHETHISSVDASGNLVRRQQSGYWSRWGDAAIGSDPSHVSSYYYGPAFGLAVKGAGVFFIGSDCDGCAYPNPFIAYHDYSSPTGVTHIMGDQPRASAADNSTPGAAVNLPVDCGYGSPCAPYYSVGEDRLYFSEGSKIRYLTTPTNTATSTLGTLMTSAFGTIRSYAITPDGTKVFYRGESTSKLYCHDISSGDPWCNDTVLGPPTEMSTLGSVRNQFTWKDANTLLMSTGNGEILQYTFP
jgi:hypothetical protein